MKQAVVDVTRRIRERSAAARRDHLARIDVMLARPRGADRLGCANLAHATAALPRAGKLSVVAARAPNGMRRNIVSAEEGACTWL